MSRKAPTTRSKYRTTGTPYENARKGKSSRIRTQTIFYEPPGPSEIKRITTTKKEYKIKKEIARRIVVPHMIGSTLENEFACFMWSIGDRYHDWWPADRGDIKSFKKCGSWKFLPDIIRYGIVAESMRAIYRMGTPPNNMTTLINDYKITPGLVDVNRSQPANRISSSVLNMLKKYTLGDYLKLYLKMQSKNIKIDAMFYLVKITVFHGLL